MRHCHSKKHKCRLTLHCLSVVLPFVMGSVGLTESHLPLLSPARSHIRGDRDGDEVFWQRKTYLSPWQRERWEGYYPAEAEHGLSIMSPPGASGCAARKWRINKKLRTGKIKEIKQCVNNGGKVVFIIYLFFHLSVCCQNMNLTVVLLEKFYYSVNYRFSFSPVSHHSCQCVIFKPQWCPGLRQK